MLRNIIFVAFGGAMGSVFRYVTAMIVSTKKFPASTFLVNIIGSFLIGILMGYLLKQTNNQNWQLLMVTGFCGGFTTFSAFSWDVILLMQQARYATAIFYVVATFVLSIFFCFLGFNISK